MKKILIIDDENKTKDFIKKLLISFGPKFEIYTDGSNVETGIQALSTANSNSSTSIGFNIYARALKLMACMAYS